MSLLLTKFYENLNYLQVGVDEAGRGPLFGRVYAAAVILPDDGFSHELMKDSKKIYSDKKMNKLANYIKEKAIAWSIKYQDEKEIDKINIFQATQLCMIESVKEVIEKMKTENLFNNKDINLLIDGNYFKAPLLMIKYPRIKEINCVKGGDNKFTCIAAASILAKQARDQYIYDLCELNPELKDHYNLQKNKGYGAKVHLEGIEKYGISKWHRKSFGICKTIQLEEES